ncbi:MAG: hypothetical protein KC619_19780 [Myxococcales bacterium]|nr:hypothetical protein [Myxococcales bacterium]
MGRGRVLARGACARRGRQRRTPRSFPRALGTEQDIDDAEPVLLDGSNAVLLRVRSIQRACPDPRFARTTAWAAAPFGDR